MAVLLETSVGDITIDLLTEERPKCCKNFLKLCKVKYYNFSLFHSVQRNLVAQTGDPTGTGKGGESVSGLLYGEQAKYFDMEVAPRIRHKTIGTLSMVNNGSNMHGSQFFITLGENLDYLDNVHTVFGEVSEGMDVLMKINEAYCDAQHRPFKDIRIYHTIILDDPYDDPPGLEVPDRSPEPTKEQLDSGRIGADEDIDDFKGMSASEIASILEEKEASANAQILTMVGDLPEEDIAPPENVLFVCKLNPVTTDEDLEIIFSRFGTIVSCEVIRDQKTKESLQYAFIEFSHQKECENAYFKMDNVLIDDRRIHVDFSQSVSKFKWKGKGKGVDVMKDETKDDFASNYRIKDNSRRDTKYDLVYEEEDSDTDKAKKKRKKKKHKARRDSSGDSEQEKSSKPKKVRRKKSESPHEDIRSRRNKSRSPEKYRDRDEKYRQKVDRYNKDRDDKYSKDRENKYSKDREDKYSKGRDDKYRDSERSDKYRDREDKYRDSDRERSDKHRDRDRDRDSQKHRDRRDR